MPEVVVRPYRDGDEAALRRLAGEASTGAEVALPAPDRDVVFVAEVEGEAAGYEALAHGSAAVRIDQLLVSPHHDDEGIERQLLAYAEGYAISIGARLLEAVVEPDNGAAVTFYREQGFAEAAPGVVQLVLPQQ